MTYKHHNRLLQNQQYPILLGLYHRPLPLRYLIMYNPISTQFFHNLKESRNCARKKCIAPLARRLAPIFLAVANVEKRGARDPADWSGVSVMCVAREFSFFVESEL